MYNVQSVAAEQCWDLNEEVAKSCQMLEAENVSLEGEMTKIKALYDKIRNLSFQPSDFQNEYIGMKCKLQHTLSYWMIQNREVDKNLVEVLIKNGINLVDLTAFLTSRQATLKTAQFVRCYHSWAPDAATKESIVALVKDGTWLNRYKNYLLLSSLGSR